MPPSTFFVDLYLTTKKSIQSSISLESSWYKEGNDLHQIERRICINEQACSKMSEHSSKWAHPPLDSPQKKIQKTHSGDPKNYHLGCFGYPKQHQTKLFESKIFEKATFYAKNKHFLPYLAISLFIQLPKF